MKISTSTLHDPPTVVHRRELSDGESPSSRGGYSGRSGGPGPRFSFSSLATTPSCDMWPPFKMEVAVAVGSNPCALLEIDSIFTSKFHLLGDCTYCRTRADKWLKTLQSEVARVRPFSEFM